MRGISGATAAFALVLVAGASQAGLPVAEASGNWAGSQGGGFWFHATLEQDGDAATLRIWNAVDGVPDAGGDPDLNVAGFALSAFVAEDGQRLEVVETGSGNLLQVVTEYADEEGAGREVVQLAFLDNQFTLVGYYHNAQIFAPDGSAEVLECEVDLTSGEVTVNGTRSQLPPLDADALNASGWHYGEAVNRGWCPGF